MIKDPNAAREAKNYENPIPSREFILELLEKIGASTRDVIAEHLKIDDPEQEEALRRRLRAMVRDGQLMRAGKKQFAILDRSEFMAGRVQAHRDGFGFFIPDDGGDDYYLNGRQMAMVFNGDRVLVREAGKNFRGQLEAMIMEVTESNTHKVVGRYMEEKGLKFVTPDNSRIQHDIMITVDSGLAVEIGQYVIVEIIDQPKWNSAPTGTIIDVLGNHMAPGMEIDVAIHSHGIPNEWPEELLAETAKLSDEPLEADKKHRVDLRDLNFVTIDGEDARDFDDAVYCEKKKSGGWRLWVAIADVSHYVQIGSALDEEAHKRSTSVYFPERVIPMLPEKLSNGLCSLKPEVDRLCMVCEMTISAKGNVSGYKFYEGLMHSSARLTYNKVAAMLNPEHANYESLIDRYQTILPDIQNLHDLYIALRAARSERGAIDFETTETRILYGSDRKIDQIVPVERNDAHKMIEECMLAANVAAARFLNKHKILGLYRVHEGPSERKLTNLQEFLKGLGMNLSVGAKPAPEDYQVIMSAIQARPDADIIQVMLLRSLSQAVYQPENKGHFGLNYKAYAHFTSPIRRYPDLLMHRALRYAIRNRIDSNNIIASTAPKMAKAKIYPYDLPALLVLGEHCSMAERRADDATRDVVSWLKCEYLLDHVGDEFDGTVTAVAGFGFFVELAGIYIEGLVHVRNLDGDFFNFDPVRQCLEGERSHMVFRMGDAVKVRVAKVDLEERKIDLALAEKPRGSRSRKAADPKSKRSAVKAAAAKKKSALKEKQKPSGKSKAVKAKKSKAAKKEAKSATSKKTVRKRKRK